MKIYAIICHKLVLTQFWSKVVSWRFEITTDVMRMCNVYQADSIGEIIAHLKNKCFHQCYLSSIQSRGVIIIIKGKVSVSKLRVHTAMHY